VWYRSTDSPAARSVAARRKVLSNRSAIDPRCAGALSRNPAILILDEPTSALDVETDAQVMDEIKQVARGCTTFIIAHRLSTIRSCDLILVLRAGVVAERGTFAELMARNNGVFAELYNTQFRDSEENLALVA
jgi:ABC-type multidrug transport system fused ATPase/permease subunit